MPKSKNNEDLKQYRKKIIIEATNTLILEIGIEGLTIDKILKKINEKDTKNSLGKGTLYEVFKSKASIIEGLALYIVEKFSLILDDEFNKKKGKDLIEFYIETCIDLANYYQAHQEATRHTLRKILSTRTLEQTVDETNASSQIQLELQNDIRDTLGKAFDHWLQDIKPEQLDNARDDALFLLGGLIDGAISRSLYRQPNTEEILNHLTIILISNRAVKDTY